MKKSHRVALRPTPEQESRFLQHAGYSRFAYNWAVGEFQAGLQVGEWLSERSLRPRWNLVKGIIAPWGRELSQNSAKYAIIDLGQAASRWGEYRRKWKQGIPCRRVGFPRFKRRKHEQGFRADNGPDTVMALGRAVILPKIGRVTMVEHLRFSGRINEVTVNRTAGRWFACFSVETGEPLPPVKDGSTVGVDVGIENLAVCSDGTVVENPRVLKPALRRLRNLDKAIARSRKAHGRSAHSNRRERLYARRRRLHARIVNVRNDLHHKATTAIAKSAGRGGDRGPECGWDDEQPEALPGLGRCRDLRLPDQAGVQVPVVRGGAGQGGPSGTHRPSCAPGAARKTRASPFRNAGGDVTAVELCTKGT